MSKVFISHSCNNYLRILSLISNIICWVILFSPNDFHNTFPSVVWCGNFCLNQYYSFVFCFVYTALPKVD